MTHEWMNDKKYINLITIFNQIMISKPSACAATAVDSGCGAGDRRRRREEGCPYGKTVPDCHEGVG